MTTTWSGDVELSSRSSNLTNIQDKGFLGLLLSDNSIGKPRSHF